MDDVTLPVALAAATAALALVGPAPVATEAGARAPAERAGPPGAVASDTSHADTLPDAAADTAAVADSLIDYRREVFRYPTGTRRDPFSPLTGMQTSGPRLEDLQLTGVLFSRGSGSVAVLLDPESGRRYKLRTGDRIGQARLVEIGAGRAVFVVDAFGFDRRTVLRLSREEEPSQ